MGDDDDFAGLIDRARRGDQDAASLLVRRFEPEIRRKVRAWLRVRGPDQRAVFESMDICQSVMAIFFDRAKSAHFDLDRPERALHLLVVIAQNKVRERVRDGRRLRRDARRNRPLDEARKVATGADSPSQIVANRELLHAFEAELSSQERRIAELRAEGAGWSDVAAELGGTPESRRKQWARTLIRVSGRLGLGTDEAP